MQFSVKRWGLGFGILLCSATESRPRADVPPPPTWSARVLPSTGCTMPELVRAFARHRQSAMSCMRDEAYGTLTMSCTFDAAGGLQVCEAKPSKGSDFSKRIVACMQRSLAKLHLDPKAGDPTKCTAQLEFQIKHGKIHRKYRCTSPDDPLCGL